MSKVRLDALDVYESLIKKYDPSIFEEAEYMIYILTMVGSHVLMESLPEDKHEEGIQFFGEYLKKHLKEFKEIINSLE